MTFRVPIMSAEWVYELWARRNEVDIRSDDEIIIDTYKLRPFFNAKVFFYGFSEEERRHMCEVLRQQGGEVAEDIEDVGCTHVVVDESIKQTLPHTRAYVVKSEWFWTSVQNEGAADEKEYLFEDHLESLLTPTVNRSQQSSTPVTSARRKRKRIVETLSSLVQSGVDSPAFLKRRSSVSDAGHLSVSGSFLDCTASPDTHLLNDIPEAVSVSVDSIRKIISPRHQVFLELVQTESNYVGILSTIMNMFKYPLESLIDTSGELLNSTEVS